MIGDNIMSQEFDKDKEEKIDAHFWRIGDFWGRHNLSSRSLVLTLIGIMISFTVGFFMGLPVPAEVITSAIWAFAAVIIIYAIGPTAIQNAADLVSKLKGFR